MKKLPDRETAAEGTVIRPATFKPVAAGSARSRVSLSPRTVLKAAFFAACAFAAWFLVSAKSVSVGADPEEADVSIGTLLQLHFGGQYLLPRGDYDVRIEAAGYKPATESITVSEEENQHFQFRLERLPGHVAVDTGPVAGADVVIGGRPAGKTPVLVRDVPYGDHLVQITADRYLPFEQTVNVEGLDREQKLSVELKPAWAEVTLASEPAGAEVLVDDESVGVTPLMTEILEGQRSVRVRSAGYKDWQRTLNINAGEPQDITDIRLDPAEAVVRLVSEPAGASTTLNGEYKGLTPLELALAPGETSTIKLFKQGYKGATRQVAAKSGDSSTLSIRLESEMASVEISVEPADAKVYVDGVLKGSGAQTLTLPARSHRIEVRRDGYVDYVTTVTPNSGFAQKVKARLQTQEAARLAAIKPLIQTAKGQSLKLFGPAKFTMGASRREPGRRANETLRNVELTRSFYLGLKEVTNAQFKEFEQGHSSGRVQDHSLDGEDQPVVMVNWEQAARYCNWLSEAESLPAYYRVDGARVVGVNPAARGYRLPTEAEWEWVARMRTDASLVRFPWGDQMPPPKGSGNYADETASGLIGKVIVNFDDGFPVTAPAGHFPANTSGIHDMGGNVSEWVHDYYSIESTESDAPVINPMGPDSGEFHVIRGSSWAHGGISELRLSFRDYGNQPRQDVGFRLARNLD